MAGDRRLLGELVRAVVDGAAVDWAAAEARTHPAERTRLAQLRAISAITTRRRPDNAATPSPPVADREAAPQRWGPLKVLEPIGSGASGVVYRAWDPRLDREVALKLVPIRAGADPGTSASSMLREGRLLARVRHPNVVTVHGAERIGDAVGVDGTDSWPHPR